MFTNKTFLVFLAAMLISGCGGGGGTTAPAPTVSISADPLIVLLTNASTITWSSTNTTSCSASGSWSGTKTISGSEAVTISTTGNNTYTLSCTGAGGSRSSSVTVEGYRNTDGVVVDGYISGAEVFIDEDDDWVADSNESSTTSDNDGKFTIKYANGNLVSIGGTDLDSQTLLDNLLITHKLTGHSDFKAVTPVTSVAAFMTEASNINSALGIDSSIDVFTFDPVANKGDGGINDFLYEKGNQLTALAYAFQNITNNLNTTTETTQDYFKAITEEIEKEYTETTTKVDIETEAFITKTLDNVIAAKTLTIADDAKANTTKALSGVMPIIEVKSSNDLTTSVIRFAVSTLQTDIKAIANGTASAETLTSYTTDVLNYIATDQNIDANEITPDISAIADSASTSEDTAVDIIVLANDSFITTAPITVTAANGSNGSSAVTSNVITYTPNADFNGTDTFSYTITQGDKTSSADVSISIEAVNDAPSIDVASTIQAAENQTAVATISVSDVDEDDLTLTLSGTDTDSFGLSTDNVLTFKEAPDFETKSSYSITLSLTDGIETVTKDLTISIINTNDLAPEFTSETIFTTDENQTSIGTITATDAEGDDVTFTVSGNDLTITANGLLTFVTAPNYETQTTYIESITASDGVNNTLQEITINVNDINEAPEFSSSLTFDIEENIITVGNVTASDPEEDGLTFFIGDKFEITSNGLVTFKVIPNYETKSSYTSTIKIFDGVNEVVEELKVNVIDVNELPAFTSSAIFTVEENQKSIGTIIAIDEDGDQLVYTISGNEINISSGGVVSFISAPDYETKSSYSELVTVNDGTNTLSQNITVNIIDTNDNVPIFTSNSIFSIPENQVEIGLVSASDIDDEIISFEVSGNELKIDGSGLLSFLNAPDYETKNTFTALVSASDGQNTSTQDIVINVTNLNDVAPIFGPTEYTVDERQFAIGSVDISDIDGDSIVLSLSGNDAEYINVDSSSKILSFINIPKFNEKSKYEATISASDGINITSKSLSVNINEISQLQTDHPQAIFGTDGNDVINGDDKTYNILIGGSGDDTLIGGDNSRSGGGYVMNIFQFSDNSGTDVIKDFFIQELVEEGTNSSYGTVDGRYKSDIIEVVSGINSTDIKTAQELLNNSTNNSSGHAEINLGQGNSITIEGISIDDIGPQYFHIIPEYLNVIQGSDSPGKSGHNKLIASTLNSRLEGSDHPFSLRDDGYDTLISNSGDDLLIGGTNNRSFGGTILDLYKFGNDNGNDLIIGYYDLDFTREKNVNYIYTNPQGSGARTDKILIPINVNNTSINSFKDLQDRSSDNADGWAKLDLGSDNFITTHMVPISKLTASTFVFLYSESYTEIFGTSLNIGGENNILYGTSGNDWIDASENFLCYFCSGVDYIFPGSGDDILVSGTLYPTASSNTFFTTNFFINEPGNKTIVGLSSSKSELFNPNTRQSLDRIFIEKNTAFNYLSEIPISYDDDGFLELNISNSSKIKLHAIKEGDIHVDNIILHDSLDTYVYGTEFDDELFGTSGNDYIDGWAENDPFSGCGGVGSGNDILNGKEGNDVLVGGPSMHNCGGFNRDIFKFDANSGHDIVVDFTSSFERPGYVNYRKHMDILEIEENINGINFRTATELLNISQNNTDGFAEINLGGSNKITLHGKSIASIEPVHFRIIPKIDNYIIGTNEKDNFLYNNLFKENDNLKGTDQNDYIKGRVDTLDRTDTGWDILDGGAGDDVLDGGSFNRQYGGYVVDIYKFDKNYGYDRVFGFSASDIYEAYRDGLTGYDEYEAGIKSDKIQIPNDVVSSATEIINNAVTNEDGWAVLSFEGTQIVLHMISVDQLKPDYFHIIPRTSSDITGSFEEAGLRGINDMLIGTDANDRIMGSNNPFWISGDGSDVLEGGKGDDVLIGGPGQRDGGGWSADRYIFNSDFGNDYLISFFATDLVKYHNNASSGYGNPNGLGALHSDRLEFLNSFASSATDLINNATNNDDGWAKITLGNNSLTIFGISKDDLKPDYFHIIPAITNLIEGTNNDDTLTGTSSNDYITGSSDALGFYADGADIIDGGEGDDVLNGGANKRSGGGFIEDTFIFNDNSGNDLIIGFLFDGTGYRSEYNDVIQIKKNVNNSGITTFSDLLASTANNEDGWAKIDLGSGNSITLHGVSKSKLLIRNFIIN